MQNIYNQLLDNIDEKNILLNEPMSKHTSFKVGGMADIFVKATSIDEIKYLLEFTQKENIPLTIIGNGTNLLVKDGGIRGIVLKICLDNIIIKENNIIVAEAGAMIAKVSNVALQNSLTGLEFASGIPGTVGGAVRMNAGAYGGEMKDVVVTTTYIDKEQNIKTINNEQHKFEYRNSVFGKNDKIILSTEFKLKEGNFENIKNKTDENLALRKEKQPLNFPNAGSAFKRDENYITAKLIDECGLKGYNINDAYVSEKHAGFIVNKGNAKAKDILDLIDVIKDKVYKKFNIKINLEIEVIGED